MFHQKGAAPLVNLPRKKGQIRAIPDAPISAGSLLRRFSVVITFVLGAFLFHERNLKRKGLALAAILIGVVLLCLKP